MGDNYTASDGLTLLKILGLINLTERETRTFMDKWNSYYNGNVTNTTRNLYVEVLPYECGKKSAVIAEARNKNFKNRLAKIKLEEKIRQEILNEKSILIREII